MVGQIYFATASFNCLPARNFGKRVAGILIAAPVRGLRPSLAGRFVTTKVPKPIKRTSSPFFKDCVMDLNVASIAFSASVFVRLEAAATFVIRSLLFTIYI